MTIADRILELRKVKGISQEELADKIGISRQAVSKWESGQSIPDLDKIIALSEYFGVTTDFLLKGIDTNRENNEKKENPYIFNAVATAFNFLGLAISTLIWSAEQTVGAIIGGVVFIILGIMIFAIGICQTPKGERDLLKSKFWIINIWIVIFILFSLIYNMIFGMIAPYPLLTSNTILQFILFWIIYVVVCTTTMYLHIKKIRNKNVNN